MEFPGLGTLPVRDFLALLQFIEDITDSNPSVKACFSCGFTQKTPWDQGFHNEQAYQSHCVVDFSSDFYSRGFCKGGARA